MKAQREDYEHALQAVSQLTQQLDSAMLVSPMVTLLSKLNIVFGFIPY